MSQVTRVRFGLVETVERPLPTTALYSRRPKVVIGSSCKRSPSSCGAGLGAATPGEMLAPSTSKHNPTRSNPCHRGHGA